jgi:hypothetical protein
MMTVSYSAAGLRLQAELAGDVANARTQQHAAVVAGQPAGRHR